MGIVNIMTGLSNTEGHKVESIEISPDEYPGETKKIIHGGGNFNANT